MEKEMQAESLPNIPMKADYAPSEVYSSEPPPAYHRPKTASVQIAKIVSVTVILMSIILGGCILASAYITANASCRQLEQELQLLTETADRMQPLPPIQPEALTREEPRINQTSEAPKLAEPRNKIKEVEDNGVAEEPEQNSNSDFSSDEEDSEETEKVTPIHIKLPLHIDMDDIAGTMLDKNQRSKMNCIVEKKRAEEVVDHKPKTVNLPFGVNLTTDPRLERITGERMVIICESGSLQRHMQPSVQSPQQSDDQEETVMVQPIVIPIGPINPYQTHMPQQMHPSIPQQMQPPMETLRPPMPPMMPQRFSQQPPQNNPNLPNPFIQNIIQQLIAQRMRMEMQRAAAEESSQQKDSAETLMPRHIPIPEEVLRQINRLPTNEVIISVSEQETEEPPQELRVIQHPRQSAQEMNGRQTYARGLPIHIPIPMMQHQQQTEPQEPEPQQSASGVSEELRPHYVQPRSVRSVDAALTRDKRVKRCACDCNC